MIVYARTTSKSDFFGTNKILTVHSNKKFNRYVRKNLRLQMYC